MYHRHSRTRTVQNTIIVLFVLAATLISIFLPIYIASLPLAGA